MPAKSTGTRERILESATRLVLREGYGATTVDGICGATGVTKGAFFHYFKNKEELGKALIPFYGKKRMSATAPYFDGCSAANPLERVYAWIDSAVAMAEHPGNRGCLVGTMVQEIYESHPELREGCCRSFDAACCSIASDLAAAKEAADPQPDFDPRALADTFLSLAQGSFVVAKARGNFDVFKKNMTWFRNQIETLFNQSS